MESFEVLGLYIHSEKAAEQKKISIAGLLPTAAVHADFTTYHTHNYP